MAMLVLMIVASCKQRNTKHTNVLSGPITAETIYSFSIDKVALVIGYNNEKPISLGTAFFVEPTMAVTNYHVISGCDRVELKFLNDEEVVDEVRIVKGSEAYDLALLETMKEFPFFSVDSLYAEVVGAKVYTIGNPHGLEGTITDGIISGKRESDGVDYIQITAPISPGNSGGPLLNENGSVIGVSSFTLQDSQNLNFAIPIKYLSKCVDYVPQKVQSYSRVSTNNSAHISRSFLGYSFGSSKQAVLQGMRGKGYSIQRSSEGFMAVGTSQNPIMFGGLEWEWVNFNFISDKLYDVTFCLTTDNASPQYIIEQYNQLIKQLDDKYAQCSMEIYDERNAQWSDSDTGVICRYMYMDSDGNMVNNPTKRLNMYLWYYDKNGTKLKAQQDKSEL